jgi:diguanylate cyclase (GGDEF)-like protein
MTIRMGVILEATPAPPTTILDLHADRKQHLAAGFVAAFLLCAVIVALPVAARPAPVVTPFLPIFSTAVFLTEGLTAYLLWMQFLSTAKLGFAALSGAYAYTAIIVVVQLLVFPGEFSPSGLLGAGPQSAVWLWAFWHLGSPLLVTAAIFVTARWRAPAHWRTMMSRGRLLLCLPIALALGVACLATTDGVLPQLVGDVSYERIPGSPSGITVALINAAALAYVVATTRLRTRIELWLAVALLAGLGDVVMTLAANARFSVGWYVARTASMFASSVVLGALIWEVSALYRQLHKAHARLSEFASYDGLTGLYNRRYFDEQFAAAVENARTRAQPLAIMMIDIDHFKTLNDSFGHLRGDDTLIAVAKVLRANLRRGGDFVARYGGDEFVVVLPGCDADMAGCMAHDWCVAVASCGIAAPLAPGGHVTVSVGVAAIDGRSVVSANDLLAQADAALYRAKKAGRNSAAAA